MAAKKKKKTAATKIESMKRAVKKAYKRKTRKCEACGKDVDSAWFERHRQKCASIKPSIKDEGTWRFVKGDGGHPVKAHAEPTYKAFAGKTSFDVDLHSHEDLMAQIMDLQSTIQAALIHAARGNMVGFNDKLKFAARHLVDLGAFGWRTDE